MDRVECPSCQTSYTFERLNLHPPNDPDSTTEGTIVCSVCRDTFTAKLRWKDIKTRHDTGNWFTRSILRRPPVMTWAPAIDIETRVR